MSALRVVSFIAPRPWQREAHLKRKAHRFLVCVWHRRAGKTIFALNELVEAAADPTGRQGRPRQYAYIAPYLKQAKAVAWAEVKRLALQFPGTAVNESELSVTLPNGNVVRLYGADLPEALRGIYLDGCVGDEVADWKPEVWGEILRPALADHQGWAVFIGTPHGLNELSRLYFGAAEAGDDWAVDMRRASETGIIPDAELDAARRTMTPAQYAQEFECDFQASAEDVIVPLADALEAQKRSVSGLAVVGVAKVLGVDVGGGGGGDRSVIFPRQGLVAFRPQAWRDLSPLDLATQVAIVAEEWQPDAIFVDKGGGYGTATLEQLQRLGVRAIGVDFGGSALKPTFKNRGAEMWWALREWIRAGGCLPQGQEILDDLCQRTFDTNNAAGLLQVERKERMAERGLKSPDFGDALALTFAAPVVAAAQREMPKTITPRQTQRSYHPHAGLGGAR